MGQKYIIKQTKNGLIQIPIEKYMEITSEEVIKIGNSIGIDWNTIDKNELVEGAISEAKEHPKVVTDTAKAVQVALDHLQEIPNYYSKLKEMEGEVVQKGGPGSGRKPEGKSKLYNISEVRGMAGTKDIFRTKAGYIYSKDKSGQKTYVRNIKEKKPYDPDSPEHERDIKENE